MTLFEYLPALEIACVVGITVVGWRTGGVVGALMCAAIGVVWCLVGRLGLRGLDWLAKIQDGGEPPTQGPRPSRRLDKVFGVAFVVGLCLWLFSLPIGAGLLMRVLFPRAPGRH